MSDSEGESTGDSNDFPSPPTDIDPYAVLSIPRTSTTPEIRTAYRRLALSTHPDKVPTSERASAHIKFQELAFAYAVLSDEVRRARYDATGSTSESAFGGDCEAFDWKTFFRQQVKDLVSPKAVEKFKMEYQGSEEERLAVLEAYTGSQGSMDAIFERVMVSSVLEDEERFRTIIQAAIKAGEVEPYKAFTKETAKSKKERRKKAEGEAEEAEQYAKEIGVWDELFGKKKDVTKKERMVNPGEAEVEGDEEGLESSTIPKSNGKARGKPTASKGGKKVKQVDDTSALEALIKSRQQNRQAGFLSNFEAKYGAGGSEVKEKGNKKRARGHGKKLAKDEEDEEEVAQPTEQDFQAARKRVENGMENKRGAGKEKTPENNSRGTRKSKRVKTG